MQDDAISALTSLGLSQGEAKTYVALASLGSSQATPLADFAEVPQPRIYSYLESLIAKGIITKTKISGKPNEYFANDYEVVFTKLETQLKNRIESAKQFIQNQQEQTHTKQTETVRVIQGKTAIMTALQSMATDIEDNVTIFNHSYFQDIIEKIFTNKDFKINMPLKMMSKHPFMTNLEQSPIGEVLRSRNIMVVLQDAKMMVDNPSVKSLSVIAFPSELEEIDPVMIHIFHPVILDLQIGTLSAIMKSFLSLNKGK